MNLSEFKAWFEGFSEGIDKVPTQKQWTKIEKKIAEIKPEPTKIEYIREYYDRYRPWYSGPIWGGAYALSTGGVQLANSAGAAAQDYTAMLAGTTSIADDYTAEAFRAMGRAEIAELNS